MHCSYCGSRQHSTDYCPKTSNGQRNRNALKCSYCGSRKHNRDACPRAWPGNLPIEIKDLGRSTRYVNPEIFAFTWFLWPWLKFWK